MMRIFPAFLLAGVLMASCSRPAGKSAPPPLKVAVVTPEKRSVLEYEDLPGRIDAIEDVEVKARVTGYLTKIHFKEGTEVKAGDQLYTIDPREYQAEADAAAAAWQQAEAKLTQTKSDYTRAQQLSRSTVIAKQELETRGSDVLQAEAQVRSAQANWNRAKLSLDFTDVRSPINGKISRTRITEGNLVNEGDTLTTVISQDPVYVYLEAPERVILRWDKLVKDASQAGLTTKIKISVGLLNEEGYPREGQVDFTDNELNTGTGTLQLRAVLPNPDRSLRVGLYARARLSLDQPRETLLVPERAVGIDQGQRFVYIIGQDNKVEYRKVKVGQIYDGKLAILEGLKPEDQVITEGLQMLRPGQKVEIVKPDAASQGQS